MHSSRKPLHSTLGGYHGGGFHGSLRVGWRMQPHEKQDQEPDSPKRKKPDPRDTQAKWLLFAIAILLGMITAQIIKRLV